MYNIKIINLTIGFDDEGKIARVEIKFKNNDHNLDNALVPSVIFSALSSTTFLTDECGNGFNFAQTSKRENIFNVSIRIKKNHKSDKPLSPTDIGVFVEYLQEALEKCTLTL